MSSDQDFSAFPVQCHDDSPLYTGYGLSKKELFAAMAMQGLLSNPSVSKNVLDTTALAKAAILQASELCKQLEAPKN